MPTEIEKTEDYAKRLHEKIRILLATVGDIPIGHNKHFPYGWRKAAKGRTVWRLVEEVISQNLEKSAQELGLLEFSPADSEVGVYDFSFRFDDSPKIFVNVKSAVKGGRTNKDDISKAVALVGFFERNNACQLYLLTIQIAFNDNPPKIKLDDCFVMPVSWLPDIYVNPSNNGNLQSSKYKAVDEAEKRTSLKFLELLREEMQVASKKRGAKQG